MLTLAQTLNSDLGRHVKKCSFSTHLSGRFYQNNSLESHKAKAQRIAQMKAKRKRLERSLELEEKKILYLEEMIKQRKQQRMEEERERQRAERAAIVIQSEIRRYLSIKRLEVLKVEDQIINYVVNFLQALFRGRRDRKRVHYLKMMVMKHRKEEMAAIFIQSYVRVFIAKCELGQRIKERKLQMNQAATFFQACFRGHNCRNIVRQIIKEQSAIKIQSRYRGTIGRRIRDARIQALKRKKAKRIPLHERRYSTYSIDTSRRDSISSRRRFSEVVKSVSEAERRLSGLELLRTTHTKQEQKENTEIDVHSKQSSLTSKQDFEGKCICVSESNHYKEDKILRARQKAAARVAKLKRKGQEEKERKEKQALERKNELEQLELNRRRNMMRQKLLARKEKKNVQFLKEISISNKQSNILEGPVASYTDNNINCTKTNSPKTDSNNIKATNDIVSNEIFENELKENECEFNDFEEEFQENECDLDDMG